MIHFTEDDLVSWSDFSLNWRFTDARWDCLDAQTLALMHPLSLARAAELEQSSLTLRSSGPYRMDTENFHTVKDVALTANTPCEAAFVAAWFSQLPISPTEGVYCKWRLEAMATQWGILTRHWDSFFYPFDVLSVFDDSLTWGVLFGQEENAVYVEAGAADPASPAWKFLAGYRLQRVDASSLPPEKTP